MAQNLFPCLKVVVESREGMSLHNVASHMSRAMLAPSKLRCELMEEGLCNVPNQVEGVINSNQFAFGAVG
eukprot:5129859-Amphidinium_carterae.1